MRCAPWLRRRNFSFVSSTNVPVVIRAFGTGPHQADEDRIRHAGMIIDAGVVEANRQHTVGITDGGNRTGVDGYQTHNTRPFCHASVENDTKRMMGKYFPTVYFPVGRKSFSAICQP